MADKDNSSSFQPPTEYFNINFVQHDYYYEFLSAAKLEPFRVQFGTNMGKIKKLYAERIGVSVNKLRFTCEGRYVNNDDTPKSLGMKEDDIIMVFDPEYWYLLD